MLRRSPEKPLTLFQIADDWSREIQPTRSLDELLNELVPAWWRGELLAADGPTRLKLLRALFKTSREKIPFWVKGEDVPQTAWELPDGGVEVLMAPVIPIPSVEPEGWTDEECAAAYEVVAEHWSDSYFGLIAPVVTGGISLLEPSFAQWISDCGHTPPEFWRRPQSQFPSPGQASVSTPAEVSGSVQSRKPPDRKRGPQPVKFMRVKDAMSEEARSGKVKIEELMSVSEEALSAQYGVSRETVRKARNAVWADFVGD